MMKEETFAQKYLRIKAEREKETIALAKKRMEAVKALQARINPTSLEIMGERLTDNDALLLEDLMSYFFEDTAQRVFNAFLDDHAYTQEEYVRVMNKLKRMKDKLKMK